MVKRRLSKVQQRRVEQNHQQKLMNKDESANLGEFLPQQNGLVIRRFGKVADVENEQGELFRCNIRRTLNAIVTGDSVVWRPNKDANINGVIEAINPRHSELVRPDFYDGIKPIAANIDQILIISSVLPELSFNIIDRYLVASNATGITPILVLNKIDLLSDNELIEIKKRLSYYENLGYKVLLISCKHQSGIEIIKAQLKDKTSILVGQSGVGKSSIIEQLLPNMKESIAVGDISDTSGLGQHTTTTTRLYHLPEGGNIIDSPGIREFGLWHLEEEKVINGFPEFFDYLAECKFRDCNHQTDIHCGLKKAVEENKIAKWRFNNYHNILQTMKEVKSKTNKTFK